MAKNTLLSDAKKAKNDEFYTQFADVEKEMNAYLEYNENIFRGKTILLPCDDPEWSNFTRYFAQNFEKLGLKKLVSTSYAIESKKYKVKDWQPTLFEQQAPWYDVDKSKIKAFGVPRNDFYNDEHLDIEHINNLKKSFEKDYPQLIGKKLVLYAPTFREDPKNNAVFDYFDVEKFLNELGDEYALAIRLHPNYKRFCDEEHNIDLEDLTNRYDIINFTGLKDGQKLLLLSDILIADYSSIMVDYTILQKPIVLFAYDLDDYINEERGFYFDYKENVPGKIVYNMDELIASINDEDFDLEKMEEFLKLQFGEFKPNSSKFILDYILED